MSSRILWIVSAAFVALAASCGPKPLPPVAPVEVAAKQPVEPAKAVPAEENPFFAEWTTPFGVPPFDRIKPEHYMPAFEKGIEDHNAEIKAITASTDSPTFANTLEVLEKSGALLAKVMSFSSISEIRDCVDAAMRKRFPEEFPANGQ